MELRLYLSYVGLYYSSVCNLYIYIFIRTIGLICNMFITQAQWMKGRSVVTYVTSGSLELPGWPGEDTSCVFNVRCVAHKETFFFPNVIFHPNPVGLVG